ncbi:hypothetical protein Poli38472_004273 [Pythium oligandrum]|uniref:Uncharacterized protein n=1 Tax=Pythium oligandrum TaxID=41045 RepID=A0A8K1FQD8_PYTOL|nr:hypothetical protein Poli38472_004273 [Pythium oligandrum]|eukprot:TMW66508.1 hypothetical protein Poli38472_004273 [Pythium oligandrum]
MADDMEAMSVVSLVEQHHTAVVDGEPYAAMDLCRRLLQTDSHVRRVEVAQLVLERLRSNRGDTEDHVNALLRLLGNTVSPTKELTEEMLSLLFFSDHRVQLIHHIAKLTHQSRECVKLVIDAYVELLSSDQSLLVPILASLAELPLQPADKNTIISAVEDLLDAANEEDIPAVVQSLLSMIVPSCSLRIATKIRHQVNRIESGTLSLTFEVVLRHCSAGSAALNAFLKVIRHTETVTLFDIVFLAILMGRVTENQVAVRTTTGLARKGQLTRRLIQDTVMKLHTHGWKAATTALIRFASALLAACFTGLWQSLSTTTVIHSAVEILGLLVAHRTVAQEEALSLLLSLVSQPRKLLLTASSTLPPSVALDISWDIAQAVADRLADIATTHSCSIAPFAHLFLDHLHSIASTSHAGTEAAASYQTRILDSLCRTMVILTKHEPSITSLLMITIQKQLVTHVSAVSTLHGGVAGQAASVQQTKQLMAVFLAGHVLLQKLGERRDRQPVLQWILKLLSTPTSDMTLLNVVRLVCGRDIVSMLSDQERQSCQALLSGVYRRKGVLWKGYGEATSSDAQGDVIPGLPAQKQAWLGSSLVIDVQEFVRKARLGALPMGWTINMTSTASGYDPWTKIALLRELYSGFLRFCNESLAEKTLECGFVLPPPSSRTDLHESMNESLTRLWSLVGALELSVVSVNTIVHQQQEQQSLSSADSKQARFDAARQRKRLLARVQTCWALHEQLQTLIQSIQAKMDATRKAEGKETTVNLDWIHHQLQLVGLRDVESRDTSEATMGKSIPLHRMSLDVLCTVFGGLWKQPSGLSDLNAELETALFRVLSERIKQTKASSESSSQQVQGGGVARLVAMREGRRSLKYVTRRLLEHTSELHFPDADENDSEDATHEKMQGYNVTKAGILVLCETIGAVLEQCGHARASDLELDEAVDVPWEQAAIESLAKGAVTTRAVALPASGIHVFKELIFRSLLRLTAQIKDPDVACALLEALSRLVYHAKRQTELSRFCLALLHYPYASSIAAIATPTCHLPLLSLPETVTTPIGAVAMSLSRLRAPSARLHHLAYLLVGVWSLGPSIKTGLAHLIYVLDAMEMLVKATKETQTAPSHLKKREGRRHEQSNSEDEDDRDNGESMVRWLAADGEHRVLKTLTNETLPWMLEVVLTCAVVSPLRAQPRISDATTPFVDVLTTLGLLSKCIKVFMKAEMAGYAIPARTSTAMLRSGPFLVRNLRHTVDRCVAWRLEQPEHAASGALTHLQSVVEATQGVVEVMERVAESFQERIVLKIQESRRVRSSGKTEGDDNRGTPKKSSRRWGNELLSKTYGATLQRRRAISKREAKLLPYFRHATEELKSHLSDHCKVYGLRVNAAEAEAVLHHAIDRMRLSGEDIEEIIESIDHAAAFAGFQVDATELQQIESEWSTFTGDGEDSAEEVGDEDENESLSPEVSDVEEDLEDEDLVVTQIGFPKPRLQTPSSAVNTLTPKRKPRGQSAVETTNSKRPRTTRK